MTKAIYKIFLIFLILTCVQCADFKDVFDGRETSASQTRDQPAKTSKSKTKKSKKSESASEKNEVPTEDAAGVRKPITTKEGTYYFVASGETLSGIAERYKISAVAIAHVNDMVYDSTLAVGRRLFIPNRKKLSKYVDREIAKSPSQEKQAPPAKSEGKVGTWAWPTKEGAVTSFFGTRRGRPHDGIDIGVPSGTPVFAAADGEVLYAEYFSSYGNLILIKHKNGYYSAYAHNQKMLVSKGQKVRQGDQIALSGRTGRATGPHVHFEIHKKGGAAVDPMAFLPKRE